METGTFIFHRKFFETKTKKSGFMETGTECFFKKAKKSNNMEIGTRIFSG